MLRKPRLGTTVLPTKIGTEVPKQHSKSISAASAATASGSLETAIESNAAISRSSHPKSVHRVTSDRVLTFIGQNWSAMRPLETTLWNEVHKPFPGLILPRSGRTGDNNESAGDMCSDADPSFRIMMNVSNTLSRAINDAVVRRLADAQSYPRGLDSFSHGRVESLVDGTTACARSCAETRTTL